MSVISIILGGGQGKRLFPLTLYRSKPAVPIGGKYRLVDIPISNSIHAGINRIFVLTQFNSASINNHIHNTYKFDYFSQAAVILLTAEQTLASERWFQGTADAVRCHLTHYHLREEDEVLVLSGDQLYRMDYQRLLRFHREKNADMTLSTINVPERLSPEFGMLRMAKGNRITHFWEKPKTKAEQGGEGAGKSSAFIASMGVYLFKAPVLIDLLKGSEVDFGRELIPRAIREFKTYGFSYHGYWRDIGTIKSFYQANMELTGLYPKFQFHSPKGNIFTHPRFLPPAQILSSYINDSLVSEGSVLRQATIERSIIGLRSVIQKKVSIKRSVVMGADYFEFESRDKGHIPFGIGEGTQIENAIIDKNVRIGRNVVIKNEKGVKEADGSNYYIRQGIVIVPKEAEIPDRTVI
ncbi:MAG: glucose-1-phosphate adenylyltransferase [Omnitrophica bacterium RIFCSPHIGHO2_02_FULL_49_9]|nr:MAG: glucose-1-phosphate adenylyltransferase [Omnitrophica bacterium RIFCSPHIGHO2_02_FULL_49_9]OGW88912.1 MAG: glucose-1-phosphate adenylyltransferase [Omnitrophica bacterium RIFCSPLOWO2_01_FULL_50_24]